MTQNTSTSPLSKTANSSTYYSFFFTFYTFPYNSFIYLLFIVYETSNTFFTIVYSIFDVSFQQYFFLSLKYFTTIQFNIYVVTHAEISRKIRYNNSNTLGYNCEMSCCFCWMKYGRLGTLGASAKSSVAMLAKME